MTIRSKLEQIRKKGYIFGFIAWLLFAASIFATMINLLFSVLLIIAFLAFFLAIIRLLFFLPCPSCKNNLGYAVQWPITFSIARISPKIKFCPFCGVSIDSEIPN